MITCPAATGRASARTGSRLPARTRPPASTSAHTTASSSTPATGRTLLPPARRRPGDAGGAPARRDRAWPAVVTAAGRAPASQPGAPGPGWRPAHPAAPARRRGLPGEPGPSRVPASARPPAECPSRGPRQAIRAAGTRERAVTAGTVPTGRPSACRAGAPARGRRICGRSPATTERTGGDPAAAAAAAQGERVQPQRHPVRRHAGRRQPDHGQPQRRVAGGVRRGGVPAGSRASARQCSGATFAVTIGTTPLPYPGGLVTTKDPDAASRAQ